MYYLIAQAFITYSRAWLELKKSIHTGNTEAYEGQVPRGWNCYVVIIDCH